ncbi:hypothetical protein [Xenorhabdus bovienii]|uniref:hypothetical protein n=1 Tax=Xenorhabdus bovienii TaxID=40576 RepID=UPI0023B339F1|nr:hypothetical protein [Xenorhabdus bovienii]MDE9536972.1 hypothetical protein [Xenorhabdus bovienii]MDE9589971.1 hypothetical protein [Xenorhabdus bovienii]
MEQLFRLDKILENRITRHLNMKDTAFHIVDMSRLVTPYADNTPEPIVMNDNITLTINYPDFNGEITFSPSRILNNNSYFSGGAGMAATADDLSTQEKLIANFSP